MPIVNAMSTGVGRVTWAKAPRAQQTIANVITAQNHLLIGMPDSPI
jgi:hypothetical protein